MSPMVTVVKTPTFKTVTDRFTNCSPEPAAT